MTKEEINLIVEECYTKTKIVHSNSGKFFDPKLKSINHLEVGNSKIINSWLTISIEIFIAFYTRISKRIKQWWHRMTPRTDVIYGTNLNSTVVGRITFGKRDDLAIPIHSRRVELWVRTRLFQWRKLSDGRTDRNGYFELPFDFIAARNWWNRAHLRFEIYEMTGLEKVDGKLQPNKRLFKTILIPKSDLIGMSYSLGNIQLFFWEYRDDTTIPRVVIKDHDEDAPEEYTEGRIVSMSDQFIPIELTKQKHLLQIKRVYDKFVISGI